ncbi:MAG: HSP20-like chaperone, partial [Olpidium bornovanus]
FLFPEGGERSENRGGRYYDRRGNFSAAWVPRVDAIEDDKTIRVECELPGVPKDRVNVEVNGSSNVLIISGETENRRDADNRGVRIQERRYGRFERRIGLPNSADAGKVDARMELGVLYVTIPKTAEAQLRRIHIK